MSPALRIITSKISPPVPRAERVNRQRLSDRIRELVDSHGVVWVTGTAGSGKSTAVVDALACGDRPLAWLTMDPSETAPGRLITYLEASVRGAIPSIAPVASHALDDHLSHAEAAALLAQELRNHNLVWVCDELERLADATVALEVLRSFLRHAPPSLRVVLISRRRMRLLGGEHDPAGIGRVDESDLAFTVSEAAEALTLVDSSPDEAESAVDATGGWVAGVLFEAWRSPKHVHGAGGEADGLRGYLATEIMDQLEPAERDFLVRTSVLREVTQSRAEALVGVDHAAASMMTLGTYHLPLVFSSDGLMFRCHTRFREFLYTELRHRGSLAVTNAHVTYGELLLTEERYEDATEEFLTCRSSERALAAAELAAPSVLRRLDLGVLERWLAALPSRDVEASLVLSYAAMLVAVEREQWTLGARHADRLVALSGQRSGSTMDGGVACSVAWCYYLTSRIEDARLVLSQAPETPETMAMRFATEVDLFDSPTHYRDRPANSGAAVDAMLARIDYGHGRFMGLAGEPPELWGAARSSRLAALRGLGRLDVVGKFFANQSFSNWTLIRIYAELLADLGRPEDARAVLDSGRNMLLRSGAPVFTIFNELLGAMFDLRFDRDTAAATAKLRKVEAQATARRRIRVTEQLDLCWGHVALLESDDLRAATYLRRAVGTMVYWDRLLFLPTAAVYLAEAEWRLGNEQEADTAADLALEAARRQGSTHILLQALKDFPAVVSRRLDLERYADSAWHELGRALMTSIDIGSVALYPRVLVREFGRAAVEVDGREVELRLGKSVEILAYLAAHGRRVKRADLLAALFDGTNDSARSYLRQALNGLRQALPDDARFVLEGELVVWEDETLSSDSVILQSALQHVANLQGQERIDASAHALSVIERGEYLPNSRSMWVSERSDDLRDLVNDGRQAAASAALEIGDYGHAETLLRQILRDDPYRETAWRLSMNLAGVLGQGDRVIALFRSCEESLAAIGIVPADSTRRLLDLLRR